MQKSVFYDATHRRHQIIKKLLFFVLILVLSLSILSFISLLVQPEIPVFNFITHDTRQTQNNETVYNVVQMPVGQVLNPNTAHLVANLAPLSSSVSDDITIFSYYTPWDNGAFSSLKDNINSIDTLVPERLSFWTTWLQFLSPGEDSRVTRFVRQNNKDTNIVPLITNFDYETHTWEMDVLDGILSNLSQQELFLDAIVSYVDDNWFDWITLKFRDLDKDAWEMLLPFFDRIRDRFKKEHSDWVLYVSLPLLDQRIPYHLIADNSDKLLIDVYADPTHATSPWALSSVPWFLLWLRTLSRELDPSKIAIMLPTFAYDWSSSALYPTSLSRQSVIDILRSLSGVVNYDDSSLNPFLEYHTDNTIHTVWYSDASTFFNQVSLGLRLGFDSFGLSDIGFEDWSIWDLLSQSSSSFSRKPFELEQLRNWYDIRTFWSGLAFQLRPSLQPFWSRIIQYDESLGLITAQRITDFPQSDTILRHTVWAWTKDVILTFDDGPSSDTAQILDILKQYNVPAVFFVVWDNAWKRPGLMRRIYNEWHVIGNHTFVHNDTPLISPSQFSLELNATQKIIQATTKHSSFLFRQPFAPNYHSDYDSLHTLARMGYYSFGSDMDAYDWDHPTRETIIQKTMDAAHSGNVVLLHDWGGDRSATVAALPAIIEWLRNQGYRFVDVHSALNLPKSVIMPPIWPVGQLFSFFVWGFVLLSSVLNNFFYYAFIIALLIWWFRLLIVIVFALYNHFKTNTVSFDPWFRPLVSVIVPAFNEWVVIVRTVENLLQSDYDHFEIIIVDDGSTDDTLAIARRHFSSYDRITILTQTNGWKASALNLGISKAKGKIIIVQDADTIFDISAISLLVRHFSDPHIGWVSGNVKVWNVCNLLWRCQSLEYMTSQALDRRAFDVLNCINVVPGAIWAWRKIALEQVGWLNHHTLAEDGDLTLSILRSWWRIVYEKDAIAWTEAPDTIASFLKQRFRWLFGTFQVAWKHTKAIGSFRNPWLGRFTIPYLYVSSIIFPLVIPFLDLIWFANLFLLFYYFFTGSPHLGDHGAYMLMFYSSLYLFLDWIVTILACYLEKEWNFSIALVFPIQRLLYRFLMYWLWIKVVWTALTGRWVWRNKLERTWVMSIDYTQTYESHHLYVPSISLVLFETLADTNYTSMRNRGLRMIRQSFESELLSLKKEVSR